MTNYLKNLLFAFALLLAVPTVTLEAANKHHKDDDFNTIFYAAGWDGDWRKVKKFLASGLRVDERDPIDESTPLIHAAYWGRRSIVKELIKRGANVNAQDCYGWTALMYASKWDKHEVVTDLIKAGANPNIAADDGSTAIMNAAYILWGSEKAAQTLIKRGVNVNAQDKYGWTALMYASKWDKHEVVGHLLKAGAHPNMRAKDLSTALMDAAYLGSEKAARLLVAVRADLNMQDKHGWTALMYAANHGSKKVCELLLHAGADATLKDNKGKTALAISEESLRRTIESNEERADRDRSEIRKMEEVCKLLRAHKVAPKVLKKTVIAPQAKAPIKQRITRWARWKAKIVTFFKRS